MGLGSTYRQNRLTFLKSIETECLVVRERVVRTLVIVKSTEAEIVFTHTAQAVAGGLHRADLLVSVKYSAIGSTDFLVVVAGPVGSLDQFPA
jgi:hypothetical protein